MADQPDRRGLPSSSWRRSGTSVLALVLAIAALIVGLVGYQIASEAIRSGCTLDENDDLGQRLIGVAFWLLAPAAFLVGLVATIWRGPAWSRVAGAGALATAVALVAALVTSYWDYTCSY